MVVSVMDTLTSIISGMVIFSVMGAMAKQAKTDVGSVVTGGPGLAFVAYPDALTWLPVPQLFSVLFFLMLFILGLDSEFALLENVLTSIADEFPVLRNHKLKVCVCASIFCYLVGLTFVTNGGLHVLDIVDTFGGTLSITFIAIFEVIAICWVYGIRNLVSDIKFMLNKDVGWYWKITWAGTSPIILTFILIYSLVKQKTFTSRGEPSWADGLAAIMTMISVIQIPVWAVIMVLRQPAKGLKQKFLMSLRPTEEWGPVNDDVRAYWKAQKTGATHPGPCANGNTSSVLPYGNGSYNNPAYTEHL